MRLPLAVLTAALLLLIAQSAWAQCDAGSPDFHNCFMRQQQLNRIEQNTRQAAIATAPPGSPAAVHAGAEAAGYALGLALAERRNAKRREREFRAMWVSVDAAVAADPSTVPNALTVWQACIVDTVPLFESPTTPAMEVAERAHSYCVERLGTYCIALVSAAAGGEEIDVAARTESFQTCVATSFPIENTARAILAVRNSAAE